MDHKRHAFRTAPLAAFMAEGLTGEEILRPYSRGPSGKTKYSVSGGKAVADRELREYQSRAEF